VRSQRDLEELEKYGELGI